MHKFHYNCYCFFPKKAHTDPQRRKQKLELINEQQSQTSEMTKNSYVEMEQKQTHICSLS